MVLAGIFLQINQHFMSDVVNVCLFVSDLFLFVKLLLTNVMCISFSCYIFLVYSYCLFPMHYKSHITFHFHDVSFSVIIPVIPAAARSCWSCIPRSVPRVSPGADVSAVQPASVLWPAANCGVRHATSSGPATYW